MKKPTFRKFVSAVAIAGAIAGPVKASAQQLGPQRQFLSIEGFYDRLQLDAGAGQSRLGIDGYGARLWINSAPFSGPSSFLGKTAIALYYSRSPRKDNGVGAAQYGGELYVYPTDRPYGGLIDPFLSVGAGVLRINNRQSAAFSTRADIPDGDTRHFALSPGVGVRLPFFNHVQMRLDAKDVIVFSREGRAAGTKRTSNTPEFQAGLGLTF